MGRVSCLLAVLFAGWLSGASCFGGTAVAACADRAETAPVSGLASVDTPETVADGWSVGSVGYVRQLEEELPEEINEELWDELEMDRVDELVEELLPEGKISFSDVVIQMITGQTDGLWDTILAYVKERIGYELIESRTNLIQLLFLAAIGAVFTQLAAGFGSAAVSETGFHITYLMMFGLLMSSFTVVYDLVSSLITSMVRLMQAALPIFYVAVAFSGKVTTSVVFSELSALAITAVEWMNKNLLLPGAKLFLLLTLADNLLPEAVFGKLSGLVKTAVEWGTKTLFGVVIGMNVIKGMCVPLQDSLSSGTLTKILSAIPGIGNTVDSAASLVVGSVNLVKNGIGVTAMLCLFLVGMVPVLKLGAITLLHYGAAALLEPIADSRLTAAVSGAAQAMQLVLKLLLMAMGLFFLTIALICSVTG